MYYYGARYLAPWLARWVSCDPLGVSAGFNCYRFCSNNPIVFTDSKGFQDKPATGTEGETTSKQPTISSVEFVEGQGAQLQWHVGPTWEELPKIDLDNLDVDQLQQKIQQKPSPVIDPPNLGDVIGNFAVSSALDVLLGPFNYMRLDPENTGDLTFGDVVKENLTPFPYTADQASLGEGMETLMAFIPSPGTVAKVGKAVKAVGEYITVRKLSKRGLIEGDHIVPNSVSPFPKGQGLAMSMDYKDHRSFLTTGSSKDAKAFRESLRSMIEADPINGYQEAHLIVVQLYYEEFGLKYADAMYESLELLDAIGISEPIYR